MLKNLPELFYDGKPALPPQEKDLQRLYDLIIASRSTTILEFGCGYSTFVIAEALKENKRWFESLKKKPEVRNPDLFWCECFETNADWIEEIQQHICKNVSIVFTQCYETNHNDQLSHIYGEKPSVLPDFIYLDGPDPEQVEDWPWNMPISADILWIEPILIPGTTVLIDGRTNNARFLARNLQRNWLIEENQEEDYTLMKLDEPSLGPVIANGADILRWIKQQN